jgi:hypothetical protein
MSVNLDSEPWLNEGQAILLFTKMNTGQRKDATFDVISVYMACRHGHMPQQINQILQRSPAAVNSGKMGKNIPLCRQKSRTPEVK